MSISKAWVSSQTDTDPHRFPTRAMQSKALARKIDTQEKSAA
jgi:hypothetical protein